MSDNQKNSSILNIVKGYVKENKKESALSRFPEERNPIWTTKEGKRLPVAQMTDKHIESCIRLLGKRPHTNSKVEAWITVFEDELSKRGKPYD